MQRIAYGIVVDFCKQHINNHYVFPDQFAFPGYCPSPGDSHYIDVIMTTMASQITSLTVVYLTVYCHWPLCGEFTETGESSAQRASNAEMFPFDDVIM